jgi:hypothetical protein
MRKGRGWNED